MSPIITLATGIVLAAYGIIIIIELAVKRSLKRFLYELAALLLVVLLLRVTVNFPQARQSFGGVAPLPAIGIIFVSILLGMCANYFFYAKTFSWTSLLKPLVISPIILLPLVGSIQGGTNIEAVQLISMSIDFPASF